MNKNQCDLITGKISLSNNPFSELNSSRGLKIACININSLLKNIDQLCIMLENNRLDILAIDETKIDNTISDNEISIPGYHHIRKDRSTHCGGVLLYARESLSFSERNDLLVANSLQVLSIEIVKPHNKSFLVSTWYRHPKSDDCLFNYIEAFLRKCVIEHLEVILIRDLNCDMLKHPPEAHTRKLNFLSSLYQYKQLISKPTRVTRTSATLIDLILTNNEENIFKSGVIHLGISDHSLIFTIRKYCAPKSEQSTLRLTILVL